MTLRALLYLDYDVETGLGHVSRARGFIEALSTRPTEIYICSKLNPKTNEPQLDFLKQVTWVSYEMAKMSQYSLIYVDTYDKQLLATFKCWPIDLKVILLDSNYSFEMPSWADFIIDIERSSPRNHRFQGEYLFGDILLHSELELSRNKMRNKADAKIGLSKLEVAINFGGSLKVARHFNRLEHIFLAHEDVSFSIYCPLGLSQEVNAHFLEYQNVKVKEFTSNYLQELPRYDFLITSTGTSFLEGLFVDIPLIIFSLFPNASSNFERFQRERRILFSGTVHELENLDLTETIKRLYAMRDLRNSESKIESDLITIGQIELQAILLKILK